jgi:hypothetical protein
LRTAQRTSVTDANIVGIESAAPHLEKGNMHPQPLGQDAAADRAGRLRADAARLAWASVLGMSLFAAATVALHLLGPDLHPISRTVSEYVLAPARTGFARQCSPATTGAPWAWWTP